MIPLRQEVIEAYQAFLGRPPESEAAIRDQQRGHASTVAMVQALIASQEGRARQAAVSGVVPLGPDAAGVLAGFGVPSAPVPGFVTDFIGTRSDVTFSTPLAARGGTVVPVPEGADAESATWLGILAAVADAAARGQFRMAALGAGYGQWAVRGLVAARQRGIAHAHLIASEPDRSRVGFIRQHLTDNGFDLAVSTLHHMAVGVADGAAQVLDGDPCAPEPFAAPLLGNQAAAPSADPAFAYTLVDVRTVGSLIGSEIIDVCHLRVGAAAGAIVDSARPVLDTTVRRLVVETVARRLEGDLMAGLTGLTGTSWQLDHEHPCALEQVHGVWRCARAGVQVWRNTGLTRS
jgi:hypothetical protein